MFSSSKGKVEIAVWRSSDGNWYISPQNLPYEERQDTRRIANLGGPNDTPVPADYDGDGKANIAVWKPATGEWCVQNYKGQQQASFQWGQVMGQDDTPVPSTSLVSMGPSDGTGRYAGSSQLSPYKEGSNRRISPAADV